MSEFMTTTGAAQYYTDQGYELKTWQVRRAYESGLMPEPEMRMGAYRIIKVIAWSARRVILDHEPVSPF